MVIRPMNNVMEEIVSPDAPRWRKYLIYGVLVALALAVILDPIIAYKGCRICQTVHSHPIFSIIYYASFFAICGSLMWAIYFRSSRAVGKKLKLTIPIVLLSTCFAGLMTMSSYFLLAYLVATGDSLTGAFLASIGALGLIGIPIFVFLLIAAILEKAPPHCGATTEE